ncbi:MAG: hypothetical protein EA404_07925, partial [Spirochaetaceae bacterium]
DEETAVVQFGKGDKYFGVATVMVTMPGLPMFGHGQVQGFAEKYGMEFRRAYWQEKPDMELVGRHQRELFPLMRRRYQFSGVDNFRLYDLWGDQGQVHEDVYAYSNQAYGARSLVLYNNAYQTVWGWLSMSAGYVEKDDHGNRRHRQVHLAEALGLHNDHRSFCLMYENNSGLWYIRNSADLCNNGLYVELQGYQTQVFLDIYEVTDNEYAHYARLADSLRGGGVPDVDTALKEIYLKPLHESFALVANSGVCQELSSEFSGRKPKQASTWVELQDNYQRFLRVASEYSCGSGDVEGAAAEFKARLRTLLATRHLELVRPQEHVPSFKKALHAFTLGLRETPARVSTMIALLMLKPLSVLVHEDQPDAEDGCEEGQPNSAAGLAEDLMLLSRLDPVLPLRPYENEDSVAWKLRVRILLSNYNWLSLVEEGHSAAEITENLLSHSDINDYLNINTHQGEVWYNKERMDTLIWWLLAVGMLQIAYDDYTTRDSTSPDQSGEIVMTRVLRLYDYYERLRHAHEVADYRVQRLLDALNQPSVEADS